MPSANRPKKLTVAIRGFVVPDDWNADDEVVAVAISTDDAEEYLVDNAGLGRELIDHLDDYVEVRGKVRSDHFGYKSITVDEYVVLAYD